MNIGDKAYLKSEVDQSFLINIILSPYKITCKKSTLLKDDKGNKFEDTQFMLESNKWVLETELVPFENIGLYLTALYNEQYNKYIKQLMAITNVFTYTNFSNESYIIHPYCEDLYWIVENTLMETKVYDYVSNAYLRDLGWQLIYHDYTFDKEVYRIIEWVSYSSGRLGKLFKDWLFSQTKDCGWEDFMEYQNKV